MVAPAGVYFLTSRSQWNDYVLPVYALSGAAGLLGVVCDLLEIADLPPAPGSRSWSLAAASSSSRSRSC